MFLLLTQHTMPHSWLSHQTLHLGNANSAAIASPCSTVGQTKLRITRVLFAPLLLQVHDIKGRRDQVVCLLEQHGFSRVTVEQPAQLSGTDLYNVYATRAPAEG